jgi:hypothetical protein
MEAGRRPPEARFREELARLRSIPPANGQVLLDQLEYRWEHPDCPPALYVLSLTLRAPEGGSLVDDVGNPVSQLVCTKVGQAKRTLAARFHAYTKQVLGGVPIVEGSQDLRVVIYGEGSTMPLERDIKAVARDIGTRAQKVIGEREPRPVGTETYVGVEIIDLICSFAWQRDRS